MKELSSAEKATQYEMEKQLLSEMIALDKAACDKLSEILQRTPPYERQFVWHELNRRNFFIQQMNYAITRLSEE